MYYHQLSSHSYCAIATILDPRVNIGVFDIVLPSSAYNRQKAKMRTDFKDCYHKYQDRAIQMRSSKGVADTDKAISPGLEDDDSDAELYSKQPKEFENKIEWKEWLKQPIVGRKTVIMHYWKAKQFDFPIVSQIARDHLAIPAMSAPLESVFSDGGNVVTKNRNRLSGDSVRETIRLRNWGVITEEDDVKSMRFRESGYGTLIWCHVGGQVIGLEDRSKNDSIIQRISRYPLHLWECHLSKNQNRPARETTAPHPSVIYSAVSHTLYILAPNIARNTRTWTDRMLQQYNKTP
jgi:hypothetical protein